MVNVIAMIFHCYCLETPARYILLLLWLQPFIPSGPAQLPGSEAYRQDCGRPLPSQTFWDSPRWQEDAVHQDQNLTPHEQFLPCCRWEPKQVPGPPHPHWPSVCLHAHLSRITAIVWLCYSIRQLQSSEYTCRWENQITGESMSYPGTLGGAVPISTSGNRNTSGWPLYVTSCLGIQERWRTKSETKLHLCTLRIWCTW